MSREFALIVRFQSNWEHDTRNQFQRNPEWFSILLLMALKTAVDIPNIPLIHSRRQSRFQMQYDYHARKTFCINYHRCCRRDRTAPNQFNSFLLNREFLFREFFITTFRRCVYLVYIRHFWSVPYTWKHLHVPFVGSDASHIYSFSEFPLARGKIF